MDVSLTVLQELMTREESHEEKECKKKVVSGGKDTRTRLTEAKGGPLEVGTQSYSLRICIQVLVCVLVYTQPYQQQPIRAKESGQVCDFDINYT